MKTNIELVVWLEQIAIHALDENKENYILAARAIAGMDPLMEDGNKIFTVALVPMQNDPDHATAVHCRLFTHVTSKDEYTAQKHNFALARHPLYPILEGYMKANPSEMMENENVEVLSNGKPN